MDLDGSSFGFLIEDGNYFSSDPHGLQLGFMRAGDFDLQAGHGFNAYPDVAFQHSSVVRDFDSAHEAVANGGPFG